MVQIGDSTLNSILDVLCKIYRGEVRLYNDQCSSGSFIIFQLILTIAHSFLIGTIFLKFAGVTLYSVLGQGKFY